MKNRVFLLLIAVLLVLSPAFIVAGGDEEAAQSSAVTDAALAYFADKADDNNMIAQDAFVEMVKSGTDMFILDIRRAEDYAAGHIAGAFNAPWGAAIGESLEFLPDDQPVYVYCYSGQTAGQAVAALNVAGIQAKSVRYGFSLGISKVDGYEDILETKANQFGASEGVKFNEEIKAAVVAYFDAIGSDEFAPSNIVSAAKAKQAIDESEGDVVILSIRQPDAYAQAHIPGAVNIPWAKGMQEQFSTLPMDKKILTYCYSGQTAGQAVAILRLLGYDAVSIKSGMGTAATGSSGWANEGFPTVGN